jgi:hypothetical protein
VVRACACACARRDGGPLLLFPLTCVLPTIGATRPASRSTPSSYRASASSESWASLSAQARAARSRSARAASVSVMVRGTGRGGWGGDAGRPGRRRSGGVERGRSQRVVCVGREVTEGGPSLFATLDRMEEKNGADRPLTPPSFSCPGVPPHIARPRAPLSPTPRCPTLAAPSIPRRLSSLAARETPTEKPAAALLTHGRPRRRPAVRPGAG